MRTTVSISEELLATAKARARERGQTLGEVVDAALRRELNADSATAQRPPVPTFRGGSGPRPGVDLASNRAMYEVLDDGTPLDDRR